MFESLTATGVIEAARPVVEYMREFEAQTVARMWQEYPLLMALGALLPIAALLRQGKGRHRSRRHM